MYFLIEDDDLLKNVILFEIKPALILKENSIANLSALKKLLKTKIKSYGDEATVFHDKEIRKTGSNHIC